MTFRTTSLSMALYSLAVFSTAASAQTLLSGDHSVDGALCAGPSCTGIEGFGGAALKLKSNSPDLFFDDTSSSTFPDRDWSIRTTGNAGEEILAIQDVTANTIPFNIVGAAPNNSFFLSGDGDLGMGTSLPGRDLHIVASSLAGIRLEDLGLTPGIWDINAGNEFHIRDVTNNTFPFVMYAGAPNFSLTVNSNGYIGVGPENPEAPLHLSQPGTFNFFRITAGGAAVNDSVDITFTGGPLGTGQLRYNIVDGDNQEMSLDANGNMVLDGTLTTAGPTCAGGCDRVFDAEYPLLGIEERAAQVLSDGYLPALGPTRPGGAVNVTEKLGGVINELEHAHLYITQLHTRLAEQEALAAEQAKLNAALLARLEAIEAR